MVKRYPVLTLLLGNTRFLGLLLYSAAICMTILREQVEVWRQEIGSLLSQTDTSGTEGTGVKEQLGRALAALSSRLRVSAVKLPTVPPDIPHRRTIDSVHTASVITNLDGIITRDNFLAQQYVGASNLTGLPFVVFISEEQRLMFLHKWKEALQSTPKQWAVRVKPIKRMPCQVKLTVDAVWDEKKQKTGFVCRFEPA